MTNSKRDFIKDFFVDFPNKETLKNFIDNELPLNSFDKKFLKYSDEWEQGKPSEEYIKSAYMFMDDVDAPKDKAKRYFLAMIKD